MTTTPPREVGEDARSHGGPPGQGPATMPAHGVRHAMRALQNRDFKIFWLGAMASNTGTWVQNLAVPYVLYELTSSAFWVGLATFTQFAPAILAAPYAGSLADRFDRRRVLMVTQTLQAVAAAALWAAWAGGLHQPGVVLVLVALTGVINGLNIPSWQSFVNDLVPREHLRSAITLNSLQFNAARAIGPGIAGVVLATLGPSWAFFLNAVSFVFVLVALTMIRVRVPARTTPLTGSLLRQFRRAIDYTRGQPGIQIGIVVAVLAGALGNPIAQFTVVFAGEVFEVGPLGLSTLNVALGVGAVLAAPLVSGWDDILSRATIVRWSTLLYGASLVAFAASPSYVFGVAALVLVGGSFLAMISSTNSAVQIIVADHMRGRVLGLRTVVFTGAYPLGALIQGSLADVVGPRATVAGAGALLALAAGWLWRRSDLLVRLDDPHDEVDGEAGV